jgi:ribosomal 50S subunit-recycling heat shock protein
VRKTRSGHERHDLPADSEAEGLRLDLFLKNVGLVQRRELAQEACHRGLILLDGRPAKPAAHVRPGQELEVRLGMRVRRYRIAETPHRPVPRGARGDCVELLSDEPIAPAS